MARQGQKDTGRAETPAAEDAGAAAVRVLLRHIGEDPDRPGLAGTPERVAAALDELFAGYRADPVALLQRTFEEIEGYDGMVLLKDIAFASHAERDLALFAGVAHIAYLPRRRVVGLSKLPRVVEALSRRLQTQERLTVEIARAIETGLDALGVAVLLEAEHHALTARGPRKAGARLRTSCVLGRFREDAGLRSEFLAAVAQGG